MSERLKERRALVVGASSGIGRAIALALSREGAHVALAARRTELLEEAVALTEPSAGAIALACDVRDPESCEQVVSRAVEQLDGLDVLVYATGIYPFAHLSNTDADAWRLVIETNLIGASLVTRAAMPHLEASAAGRVVFLSSISASVTPPWPGIGAYGASKAGLDRLIDAWRGEHPAVGFTKLIVGNTDISSEDPDSVPMEEPPVSEGFKLAEAAQERWTQKGYFSGRFMHPDGVAEQVVHALASREQVWEILVLGHGWSTG